MNEDAPKDPVSEADTTPPNPSNGAVPSPGQGWQMPEPKFQQSSGYLPQGYLDKVAFSPSPTVSPAASTAAAAAEIPPPGDVVPQPDLTDQLAEPAPPPASLPAPKERSTGARVLMVIAGLIAMVIFISLFLGVVYYLFLAPQGGGSTF